jgi:hypothetical protein
MGGFGKQKQRSNAIFPQVESSLITGPTLESLLDRNLWFKIQLEEMICLIVCLFVVCVDVFKEGCSWSRFESLAYVLANTTKHCYLGSSYPNNTISFQKIARISAI